MHKYDFSPQKKENIATQEHFEFTSNPMILISIFLQKPSINTNLSWFFLFLNIFHRFTLQTLTLKDYGKRIHIES